MASQKDIRLFKALGKGWGNLRVQNQIFERYGKDAYPRLLLLEEKFFATKLCYKRLKNRSKRYNNLKLTPSLFVSNSLRTLHSDEYFFFTCCGFIYHELLLLKEQGLLQDMPSDLWTRLTDLNEERRYHEHGKEWYWGKLPSNKKIGTNQGKNFDFQTNMQLLIDIYSYLASKL